ncbi:MAG: ATP-binding protein [Chloroflexota bacterium]|nr:ATP-binding protein [Chloroflexota bacterium]
MEQIERVKVTLPAKKKFLSLIGAMVQEICNEVPGLDPAASYKIHLAVDEAVSNVITHAYRNTTSGLVELIFEIWTEQLVIKIRDWGLSFDPSAIPEPDLQHPRERGYGVYLIRKLMDNVMYEEGTENGNLVTLIKRTS